MKRGPTLTKTQFIRGFKKCGLSINLDGSENHEINIEKLPDYQMPTIDDESDEEYY